MSNEQATPLTQSAIAPDATTPPFLPSTNRKKMKKVLSNSAMEARRKNKFSRPPKSTRKSPNIPAKRKRITLAKPRKKKKMPKKEDLDTDEYKPLATRAPRMDPSERYRDSKLCEYCSEHSSSGRLHSSQEKTLQLCYACYCYERSNGFLVPKEDRKSSGSRNRKRKRPDGTALPEPAAAKPKMSHKPPPSKRTSGAKSGEANVVAKKQKKETRVTMPKFNPKVSRETKYKGVRQNLSPRKGENKYLAELVVNGVASHLGSYNEMLDAAKAVNYRCDEVGVPHLNPGLGVLKPVYNHDKKIRLTKYEGVKQHQNGKYNAVVNWHHIRKFVLGTNFDNAEDAAKVVNGFFKYIDLPPPFPELSATQPDKQFVLTKYEGVRRRYGKHGGDYQAFLTHNGDRINLGPTDTAQEACEVINYKCKELGIPLKFPQFGCTKPIMLEMTEYEGVYFAHPGLKQPPYAVRFSKTGESNGVLFSFYLQKNLGEYKTKDEACAAINYKCKLLGMPHRFPHVGWMRPHKGVRRDEGYLFEESLTDAEQIKAGRYIPPKPTKKSTSVERENYRDIRKWNRPFKSGQRTKRADFYISHFDQGGVSWRVFAGQSRIRVAKHLNYICDVLGRDRKYPKSKAGPAPIWEEWSRWINDGSLEKKRKLQKKRKLKQAQFKTISKFPTVFAPQGMPFNWMFSYVKHKGKKHLAGMFKSSREAAVGANQLAIALGAEMPYPDFGIEMNRKRTFYGVVRVNDLDCYQADFSIGGKKYDLGQYETAESAAAAVHYQLVEMGVEVPNNLRTIDPVAPSSLLISDLYGKPPEGDNVKGLNNVEWRKRRQVWVGTVISDGRSYNVSANKQNECAQRLNLKCEELGEKWLNPEAGLPPGVLKTLGEEQLERVDATDEVISQWIQEEIERVGKCPRRAVRAKFNCTPKRLQRIMGKILGALKEETKEKSQSPKKDILIPAEPVLNEPVSNEEQTLPNEEHSIMNAPEEDEDEKPASPKTDVIDVDFSIKINVEESAEKELSFAPSPALMNEADCSIAIETDAEIISPIPATDEPIDNGKLVEGFWVKEDKKTISLPLCGSPNLLPAVPAPDQAAELK